MAKSAIFLLVVAAATAPAISDRRHNGDYDHSINECLNQYDVAPYVFFDKEIKREASEEVQEEIIRIPETGYTSSLITCINVINLDDDPDRGYASILQGGIGHNYVWLQLRSQEGKGFAFNVSLAYHEQGSQLIADEPHSINECSIEPTADPEIYIDEQITQEAADGVQELTIRIPEEGYTDSVIVCIDVQNLDSDLIGGYPVIVAGGLGEYYVELKLTSQDGQPLDFQVIVVVDAADHRTDDPDHTDPTDPSDTLDEPDNADEPINPDEPNNPDEPHHADIEIIGPGYLDELEYPDDQLIWIS